MKKKLPRIILFVIMISLLPSVFSSCSSSGKNAETTASEETEEAIEWLDDLPDKIDYGGMTLKYLGWDENFLGDSENQKEVISKARYDKSIHVMERLNVNIENRHPEAEGENFKDLFRTAVDSDMCDFDFVMGYGTQIVPLCVEGYLADMNNAPEFSIINLEKEWWAKDFTSELNVGDHVFWVFGDLTSDQETQAYCVFVNNSLFALVDKDGKKIYDYVHTGDWTLDTMIRISRDAYLDDGDGEKNSADRMALGQQNDNFIDVFAIGANATYSLRDENNMPYAAIDSEVNVTINEKLYDLVHLDGYRNGVTVTGNFCQGNLMFFAECVAEANAMRDMKDDWTMIPLPKLSQEQEYYYTTVHESFQPAGIPVTASEDVYEAVFTLWEASAAEHRRLLRPAILDEALKNKYSRDEETKEMVDLITAHTTTDFLIVYGQNTGMNSFFYNNCFAARDISSQISRKMKPLNKVIDGIIAEMDDAAD